MKKETLMEFMFKEHSIIFKLLEDFEKDSDSEEKFNKLKEKQENHAFMEEKAIFIFYQKNKKYPEITVLLEQHEELRGLIKKIGNKENLKNNSLKLKKLMASHIKLEQEKFYPRLNKELEESEKQKMLEKARSYILGNIGFN